MGEQQRRDYCCFICLSLWQPAAASQECPLSGQSPGPWSWHWGDSSWDRMETHPPCPWTGGLNLDLIPLFSYLSSLCWMMSNHLWAQEMLQTTFAEGNVYKWYVSVFSTTPLSHSSHIYNLNFRSREAFFMPLDTPPEVGSLICFTALQDTGFFTLWAEKKFASQEHMKNVYTYKTLLKKQPPHW